MSSDETDPCPIATLSPLNNTKGTEAISHTQKKPLRIPLTPSANKSDNPGVDLVKDLSSKTGSTPETITSIIPTVHTNKPHVPSSLKQQTSLDSVFGPKEFPNSTSEKMDSLPTPPAVSLMSSKPRTAAPAKNITLSFSTHQSFGLAGPPSVFSPNSSKNFLNRASIAPSLAARNSLISQYSPVIEQAREVAVVAATSSPETQNSSTEDNTPTLSSSASYPVIPFDRSNNAGIYSQTDLSASSPSLVQPTAASAGATIAPAPTGEFSIEKFRETTSELESILSDMRNLRKASKGYNMPSSKSISDIAKIDEESESDSMGIPRSKSQPLSTLLPQTEAAASDISDSEDELSTNRKLPDNSDTPRNNQTPNPVSLVSIAPPASSNSANPSSKQKAQVPIIASQSVSTSRIAPESTQYTSTLVPATSGTSSTTENRSQATQHGHYYNPTTGHPMSGIPVSVLNKDLPALPVENGATATDDIMLPSSNSNISRSNARHSTGGIGTNLDSSGVTIIPVSGPNLIVPLYPLPLPPAKTETRQLRRSRSQSLPVCLDGLEKEKLKVDTQKHNQHQMNELRNSLHSSTDTAPTEAPTPSSAILNSDIVTSSCGSLANTPGSAIMSTYSSVEGGNPALMRISSNNSSVNRQSDNLSLSSPKSNSAADFSANSKMQPVLFSSLANKGTPLSPPNYQVSNHSNSPDTPTAIPKEFQSPSTTPFVESHRKAFSADQQSTVGSFHTTRSDSSESNLDSDDKQLTPQHRESGNRVVSGGSGLGITHTVSNASLGADKSLNAERNKIPSEQLGIPIVFDNSLLPNVPADHSSALPTASSSRASVNTSVSSISDRSTIRKQSSHSQVQSAVSSTSSVKNNISVLTVSADHQRSGLPRKGSSSFSDQDTSSQLPTSPNSKTYNDQNSKKTHVISSPLLSFDPSLGEKSFSDTFDGNSAGDLMSPTSPNTTQTTHLNNKRSPETPPTGSSNGSEIFQRRIPSSHSFPLITASVSHGTEVSSQPGSPLHVKNPRPSEKLEVLTANTTNNQPLHTRDFRTSTGPDFFSIPALNQVANLAEASRRTSMPVREPIAPKDSEKPRRTSLDNVVQSSHRRSSSDLSRANARRGRNARNSGASFRHEATPNTYSDTLHAPAPPKHRISLDSVTPAPDPNRFVPLGSDSYKPAEYDSRFTSPARASSRKSENFQPHMKPLENVERYNVSDFSSPHDDIETHYHPKQSHLSYKKSLNYGNTRPSGKRIVSGGSIGTSSSASSAILHKAPQPSQSQRTRISRSSCVSSLNAYPPPAPVHRSLATPMAAAAATASAAASAAAAAVAVIAETMESSMYDTRYSSRQSSTLAVNKTSHLKREPSEKFTRFSKQFNETFRADLEPESNTSEYYHDNNNNNNNTNTRQTAPSEYTKPANKSQNKPHPFNQSSIQYLMELSDATFCLDHVDIPPTERQLIEKFVDALAKLSTDISADSNKRREGVRRLHNALRAIEGWI